MAWKSTSSVSAAATFYGPILFADYSEVYKEVTQALTLSSSHTKHWLEDNDKTGNIKVLRHPDHLPDAATFSSSFMSSIKSTGLTAGKIASMPGDALKSVYGAAGDTIL